MILLRSWGPAELVRKLPTAHNVPARGRRFRSFGALTYRSSGVTADRAGARLVGRRNKQRERDGGTAALVFSLYRHRSKRQRLLIGSGRRCRRHITELGGRRRSLLRWGRTSRCRWAQLSAPLISPVISDKQPY